MRLHVLGLVPYFTSLDPEQLAEVNTVFHARPLVSGETLLNAGDPAERFLVIVSGRVKLTASSASGAEHLVDVLGPGDSFGALPLLGASSNEASALALTGGCLLEALPEEFAALVTRFPSVALAVLEVVSARLRDTRERLRFSASAPVEARLAAALLTLSRRLGEVSGEGRSLGAPLSQEDLAALTGTTLETVNRLLSAWRKRGWVSTGRLRLTLLDEAALEAVAEQ